ncbi:hypothetical protein QPK32_01385 [Massilia sp. YIM B02763]|uniref:hypothetical protein n=1 Tax=Massilia sp. YIM B02763 TaxID=3050130 RepID=UPI0025B62B0C|nr:hypothetical protein [Massilia sp. YIM B02763]MDN4051736.1 hypothetical protein [Massilia sp. YIM B02763]
MHLAIEQAVTPARALSRLTRFVVMACIALFAFQLVAAAAHHHEDGKVKHHCAACHTAAPVLGDVPATPPLLLAVFLAAVYLLARAPAPIVVVAPAYLMPPGQGPPSLLSSLS